MILLGDCLIRLKELPDNSVDSVVTDPPYGLKFMGKKWDYDVPGVQLWVEVLRVLKPGGHLLSFGGTRTYHRLASAIEDAGFEIRDQIQWLYGSGFPKSHNIGDGIGTALKPANEPIVLARKPLEKGLTVAENVLKWGVGGLNIDASRIATDMNDPNQRFNETISGGFQNEYVGGDKKGPLTKPHGAPLQGRWPANLLLDETAAEMLDEQSGMLKSGARAKNEKNKDGNVFGQFEFNGGPCASSSGGASRFFYVAKASKRERNAGCEVNGHPTVKPIRLMEYLIKLITPPNGTVLDPFMGSGSTGVAAFRLGFKFIGCEMSEEYVEIAERRIAACLEEAI